MNSRIRFVLAGMACAALCAIASAETAGSPAQYPSPAGDSPISGPAPSSAYVWMSGHWNSEGGQWKWAAAHWELPPSRSAIWVVGHWVSSGGNWVWVNGTWNISEEQQAQAGPPQPPGPAVEAAQGGPTPTTSAPYVEGQFQAQYAPGGVAREVYPAAGTTDYGPSYSYPADYPAYDYSTYAYPGYGWAGYPVYWGLPGFALGFGWGPGFRGYGRGGYGHGGYGHGGYGHAGGHASGGQTHFTQGGSGHSGH